MKSSYQNAKGSTSGDVAHDPASLGRAISAVQRRLTVAESRPGEDWQILIENVPIWPEEVRPKEPPSRPEMLEAAFKYVPSCGIPELREAVTAREAKVSGSSLISPDHVAVTAGSMNAIGIVFRYCYALGYRQAVYADPVFRGVHDAVIAAGMSATALPLSYTEQDWDVLERASTAPLVVYVNLPSNPTGAAATAGYLSMLERFSAAHDVILLYDAIYDSFRFTEDSCATPVDLAVSRQNVIVVNSMSKNFGRPGDRVGWIVAHERVIDSISAQIEWEAVCVNPGNQLTAAAVIADGNEALVEIVRRGREAYRERTARPSHSRRSLA